VTVILFFATVVAWLALELYFVYRGQPTISERVRLLYGRFPALGLLAGLVIGLLLGHFFWAG
jgi:hypothetical protein